MPKQEPPGPAPAAGRAGGAGPPGAPGPPSRARYLVGCWLAVVGYFAGGMVAVAIAKLVGSVTNCRPPEGFPACSFEQYLQVGTVVGALLLSGSFIWRLWQNDAARRKQERG